MISPLPLLVIIVLATTFPITTKLPVIVPPVLALMELFARMNAALATVDGVFALMNAALPVSKAAMILLFCVMFVLEALLATMNAALA